MCGGADRRVGRAGRAPQPDRPAAAAAADGGGPDAAGRPDVAGHFRHHAAAGREYPGGGQRGDRGADAGRGGRGDGLPGRRPARRHARCGRGRRRGRCPGAAEDRAGRRALPGRGRGDVHRPGAGLRRLPHGEGVRRRGAGDRPRRGVGPAGVAAWRARREVGGPAGNGGQPRRRADVPRGARGRRGAGGVRGHPRTCPSATAPGCRTSTSG